MPGRLPRLALAAVAVFGAACPARHAARPRVELRPAWSTPVSTTPTAVAARGRLTAVSAGATIATFADGAAGWTAALPAEAGPLAIADGVVAVAIHGTGAVDGLAFGLRGDPGAAVVGLDPATGARRWLVGVGATEWVVVRAVTAAGADLLVAGGFAGTLRIGDRVVTSAGGSDGFWARLGADGAVRSLVRMGGVGADAVAGAVALPDGGLAVAGTYAQRAELGPVALPPIFEDGDSGDGFVARLAADGELVWARTWGGAGPDACAGLALAGDDIVVAGTARGVLDVAGRRLVAAGNGDGLVAFFDLRGSVRGASTVGGDDYDGLTAIAAVDGAVVVSGWFSGALGGVAAVGPDDPFVAVVTPEQVAASWPVSTDGAGQVRGLAATDGGLVLVLDAAAPARLRELAIPAGPTLVGLTR